MHGKRSLFLASLLKRWSSCLRGASADSKETYQNAFERVVKRADFKKISEKRLGVYDQMTKKGAGIAAGQATDVSDEARAFVKEWLKTDYNVNL